MKIKGLCCEVVCAGRTLWNVEHYGWTGDYRSFKQLVNREVSERGNVFYKNLEG